MDTRSNKEDMALTPYLGLVYVNESFKIYGLSLTWVYSSFYVALAFNLPIKKPFFIFKHKTT
jgi:hypothetical protein